MLFTIFCKQTIVLHNKPTKLQYGIQQAILLCKSADYIGVHQIKHQHNFYFILFVSSGLSMCDRLNSLVSMVIQESLICPIQVMCYLSFSSFNALHNPVCHGPKNTVCVESLPTKDWYNFSHLRKILTQRLSAKNIKCKN